MRNNKGRIARNNVIDNKIVNKLRVDKIIEKEKDTKNKNIVIFKKNIERLEVDDTLKTTNSFESKIGDKIRIM